MVRKRTAAVVTSILTAGVAAVGVGTLSHADAAGASTTRGAGAALTQTHCHAGLHKLPAGLRAEVTAARRLPAGQRGPALRAIRRQALDGRDGVLAQRWALHRVEHRAGLRALMPQSLRQDLRQVRRLPVGERHQARKAIRAKVLAGSYGASAQKQAERSRAHRQACRAQRS